MRFRSSIPACRSAIPSCSWCIVGSLLTTIIGVIAAVEGGCRPGQSRLRAFHRRVAVAHGVVRELRRSAGRRAWQGAGGSVAFHASRCTGAQAADTEDSLHSTWSRLPACARAITFWCRRATSFPPMGRSSKVWPPWMKAPSPVSPRPCCARQAETSRSVTGGTRVLSDYAGGARHAATPVSPSWTA